jgi:uncharacterized membrane protein
MQIKYKNIYKLILVTFLIFSGVIYFYRLADESLSTDEYFSLYVSQKTPSAIISQHKTASNPNTIPPLYVLILHYWLKVFGQSEFAQRSLAVVFGIPCIYLLYRISCLLFDIRTGLLSALFGSLSYTWFSLARQDRCYSLFILFTLLSFYYFFKLIKDKDAKRCFIYLTITNILLSYTHYFSFLVILMEAVFGIFEWRKNKYYLKNIILMCVLVGVAYLPWYPNLFFDLKREPVIIDKNPLVSISRTIFDFLRIMFSDFHFSWSPILTILYIPFIIRGVIRLKKAFLNYSKNLVLYLILIFIFPLVFLYFFISTDRARYYAPFMFPLFILLAYGLLGFSMRSAARKFLLFCITVFIISNNIMDFADFYNSPEDEEWRQAVTLIKQIPDYRDKNNIFILQTKYNPPVFSYYYWGPQVASRLIDNIAEKDNYEKNLSLVIAKEKLLVIEYMKGKKFFKQLTSLPDSSWIWIFRYQDRKSVV